MATRTERRIIAVRVNRRWGPARIGYLLGIHPSTVHRVLSRYRLLKLGWFDHGIGRVIRLRRRQALVEGRFGAGRNLDELWDFAPAVATFVRRDD